MAKETKTAEVAKIDITVPEVLVERFKELQVSDDEASALLTNFGVPLVEVGEMLDKYKDIKVETAEDVEQQKAAREMRLKFKKIRTGVEKTRATMKADFLRKGNAIQAVANYIREEIEPAEAYLQLQEDFIKVQEEKAIAERIKKRTEILATLGSDPAVYSLGDMSEDAFESLVTGIKDANDAKAARERAEKEAAEKLEAERVAREAELAAENAKLKAAQEAAEAKAAEERAAAQALLDAERAKSEALAKAAAEKAAQEAAEQAAKLKAEQDALEAQKAAARAAATAPDKEKILAFTKGLSIVAETRLPNVDSPEAIEIVQSIEEALHTFIGKVNERANKL